MVIFDMWSPHDGGDLPESLISGNLAFDILDNSWRGWSPYFYIPTGHLGNEVLVSIIAIPLYLLFGNSLFVLSQIPTLYSIGILILIYSISRRWLGENVAKIAALLFVCSPLIVQTWAIYPYCIHLESAFFSLLAIFFFFRLLESELLRNRILFSGALGIISGIGIFHSEMYLLTICLILLFWFLNDKLFFMKREFILFFVCFLIGLIPYIYFGPEMLPSFLKSLFGGGFSGSSTPGRETDSYITTLTLMSVVFWPINNLLLSLLNGAAVTLIGFAALALVVALKPPLWKARSLFSILALYCSLYILAALMSKVALQYYFFSLIPHMSIIFAACFAKLQTKYFSKKNLYKQVFYAVFIVCCLANVYEIVKQFNWTAFPSQLNKQLTAKGCCFYWPLGYYRPYGLKTRITKEVEIFAASTQFQLIDLGTIVPKKIIFNSKIRNAAFPLTSPNSYLIYGKDASYVGLSRIASEIESSVPQIAKEYAYKGLAVYYVNDNWMDDLIDDFKAGVIEENIPPSYQRYFYSELVRKIYNRYRNSPRNLKETINSFTGLQKQWMLETTFVSEYKIN